MNPATLLIGANDEHGLQPPTAGKRTPVMPYLGRSFYENEFNRPTKLRFLATLARLGFRVLDIKPEITDTSVSTRVRKANREGVNALVTFAYNATQNESFNPVQGTIVFYSTSNANPAGSRRLSTLVSSRINNLGVTRDLGVQTLSVGILNSVRAPSALVEAGFMTNFNEAKLMLDPQFQQIIADATAQGVCDYFDVDYVAPPATYPVLRVGSRGQFVSYLQWLLTLYGYDVGTPDGIFGTLTRNAVLRFQQDNGLVADGIAGAKTWGAAATSFSTAPLLRQGSRGVYVWYLQQKLLSKLYPVGDIDGIFGPATLSAVRAFQRENDLAVDGIVGPVTWQAVTTLGGGRPLPE